MVRGERKKVKERVVELKVGVKNFCWRELRLFMIEEERKKQTKSHRLKRTREEKRERAHHVKEGKK